MATPQEMVQFMGFPSVIQEGETGVKCAQGTDAKHKFGVEYKGPHETVADGTNYAVRLNAIALASTGLPVLLTSFAHTTVDEMGLVRPVHEAGLPEAVQKAVGHLRNASIGTSAVRILHCVITSADHLRRVLMPPSFDFIDMEEIDVILRSTIVYSVWERDRVEPEIAHLLNRVGQCWVPCSQNRDMLISSGVSADRVKVIPHPFDPESKIAQLTRRPRHFRPKGSASKRFYSIGAWQPRKGYHELIGAFLTAFKPGDDASLVIKYSGGRWDGYPSPEESIAKWLEHAQPGGREIGLSAWTEESAKKQITLIGGRISDDQIIKLHFENNIYVSSSHGEAWNLGAYDAKIAGNQMVHVPYGGTYDFCDSWLSDLQCPYTLGPVDPSYKWDPACQWAAFQVSDLARCLQAQPVDGRFERDGNFDLLFSIKAVGELMRSNVLELVRNELYNEIYESMSNATVA